MAVDVLLLPRIFGIHRDLSGVLNWRELQSTNWLGIIAMLVGVVVSIILSIPGNVIPNVGLSIGLAPFEGWVVARASVSGDDRCCAQQGRGCAGPSGWTPWRRSKTAASASFRRSSFWKARPQFGAFALTCRGGKE